uniref:Venom major-royal-jelly/yellow-like protein 1 n=1 Tax=Pristhesancus plagipennis TaxID=1955184 RepID=A0A2K8JLP9_PRIPG|nr:venom major-royal-jelly/yellow-like protein 1 [Pristhesancus plagipennis]
MHLSMRHSIYVPWLLSTAWLASGRSGSEENVKSTGTGFQEVFGWSQVDFTFQSEATRQNAIRSGDYIPESNLPLGMEVYKGRVFITLPRWKKGIPVTLAWVSLAERSRSPLLKPYPSWAWHMPGNCHGLTSVFRVAVDECGRLWVADSGAVNIVTGVKHVCTPQILVFDLNTDRLLWRYYIPKDQLPQGSLFTNIAVDVITCDRTFAYVSDVFRYGLIVYDFKQDKSWRVENSYFFPDPLQTKMHIDQLTFRWNDGIFGLALSPVEHGTRYLYFHPLSSQREFMVDTKVLHNETSAKNDADMFKIVGEPRMHCKGQASGSAMDRNGVLFYNLINRNAVGCWNSHIGEHSPRTHGIVDQNNITLSFPNDLKVDHEINQGLWVLSNRLHKYLYGKLDPNDINFRILSTFVSNAVRGTPCEEGYILPPPKPKQCPVY